jgi:hypothetical protein
VGIKASNSRVVMVFRVVTVMLKESDGGGVVAILI